MNTNVFAQLKDSLPPLLPAQDPTLPTSVFAPTPVAKKAAPSKVFAAMDEGSTPAAPATKPAASSVFAPVAPDDTESAIHDRLNQRLLTDYKKDADPYGSPDNHPGFFGKLLHGLNVATGGVNRRGWEEQGLESRAENLAKDQSEQNLQGAEGGKDVADTHEADARADALEHPVPKPAPTAKWTTLHNPSGDLLTGPSGQVLQQDEQGNLRSVPLPDGYALAPKPAPGGHSSFDEWSSNPQKFEDFQKAIAEVKAQVAAEHPHQAANSSFMNIYAAQRFLQMAYTHNPALLPMASDMIGRLLHLSPQDAAAIASTPEDQPLSPETGHPIGTSLPEAPTASTRAQAQTAARVLTELPRIRKDITSLGDDLGPTAGRWNEFMTGSVGNGDPRFEKLRADMQLVNSATAKFHLNSVKAVQEFNHLAQTGKMTAPVLHGYLDAVEDWAQTAQHQERGYGENPQEPQRPKDVPANAKYITDPKTGKKGWAW